MPTPYAPSSYSSDATPAPAIPISAKVEDKKAKATPGF
jgi:hypothetical protein